MADVWKKAEEAVEVGADAGDITMPLERLHAQYNKRAEKHEAAGHPERAEYYHEQACNITRLINQ
jgi:hypothetical protein